MATLDCVDSRPPQATPHGPRRSTIDLMSSLSSFGVHVVSSMATEFFADLVHR
jgi:hypothetical protein